MPTRDVTQIEASPRTSAETIGPIMSDALVDSALSYVCLEFERLHGSRRGDLHERQRVRFRLGTPFGRRCQTGMASSCPRAGVRAPLHPVTGAATGPLEARECSS